MVMMMVMGMMRMRMRLAQGGDDDVFRLRVYQPAEFLDVLLQDSGGFQQSFLTL